MNVCATTWWLHIHPSLLPWLRQCSVTADKQVSRGEHDGTVIYKDAHGRAAGFEPAPVFSCPGVVEHLAATDDSLASWHRVLAGRRDLRALATQAFGLA